ncbi:CRISPR system precrRNA processing endoribonuclease RAMP protein Cas6 [Sulfuricystis multivorans]|uniref:CRISPR system precrRNA processing endoribonuclease RAMP protein Cas6 n=1 Tax=Sulfuricystis multivorans TaxID=2211108 RepID=UPI000F826616|nr:CRISPR system precrRNA processing endoribonuclease RAMP protein Cas6 [Sulfuricystis multivorans]
MIVADIALPLARYRLEFEVTRPLHLPAYAGSTLRGAWGGALRAASCMTRKPVCEGCPLIHTCPYAAIFETRPPQHHAPSLQDFSQVPRPYVIEPPEMGERLYQPGERLAFHIVLAGRALAQLPLVLWAHVKAFRRGVGKGDGTAELMRVVHEGMSEQVILEGPGDAIAPHDTTPPAAAAMNQAARLHFHTPLRLQTNGRRATVEEHTARKLLMALVRRVALLCEFHGDGPLALDFPALAKHAETIESETQLDFQDWTRYSSRQQKKMSLGGVVGEWFLTGDLAPFAPFLHLGQWLHVGKEATFGLGGYRLDA